MIGMAYSAEYTEVAEVFFVPHLMGRTGTFTT
jgi:hypothetical protein